MGHNPQSIMEVRKLDPDTGTTTTLGQQRRGRVAQSCRVAIPGIGVYLDEVVAKQLGQTIFDLSVARRGFLCLSGRFHASGGLATLSARGRVFPAAVPVEFGNARTNPFGRRRDSLILVVRAREHHGPAIAE